MPTSYVRIGAHFSGVTMGNATLALAGRCAGGPTTQTLGRKSRRLDVSADFGPFGNLAASVVRGMQHMPEEHDTVISSWADGATDSATTGVPVAA